MGNQGCNTRANKSVNLAKEDIETAATAKINAKENGENNQPKQPLRVYKENSTRELYRAAKTPSQPLGSCHVTHLLRHV